VFSKLLFALVHFGARKGLSDVGAESDATARRRTTGLRGETYAYWYLRRHGYVMIARNYRAAGDPAELDLVGYDGATLAFIEVKTRTMRSQASFLPEENISEGKHRAMVRMARRFLRERRLTEVPYRFDVLAIENRPGHPPQVRLHKAAFTGSQEKAVRPPAA
jgi:putative endonuclease